MRNTVAGAAAGGVGAALSPASMRQSPSLSVSIAEESETLGGPSECGGASTSTSSLGEGLEEGTVGAMQEEDLDWEP